MADLDPRIFAEALQEWRHAPSRRKCSVKDKWCSVLGISGATFYRKAKDLLGGEKKRRADHGRHKDPRMEEWARTIVRVMGLAPKTVRRPPIGLAFRKALINGLLPPEAEGVPYSTFCRVIREKGLLEQTQRIVRFEALKPMDMWQMDASGSEHLFVARLDGKGEPVLRLRATKSDYKNKPRDGIKIWYYGMVDDHSGYWLARAYAAPGESSADNLAFFQWCACKKDDQRIPFYGLPEKIYMDNGPLARAHTTTEFFKRIDVDLKTHEPNSPEDTGKIEVRWKPLWRNFEMDLLMDPHWEKTEFSVDALNERLLNFIVAENRRAHRRLNCSRLDAWMEVMKNGGVAEISPEAWNTAFISRKVTIDRAGWFSFDGKDYEAKGIYSTRARAYRGVLDGKLMVKDLRTGGIYEAHEARYLEAGEFRGDRKQEWAEIKKEAGAMKERFAPGEFKGVYEGIETGNITYMPVRSSERMVETAFEKVDPHGETDAAKIRSEKTDALDVPRSILNDRMPMFEFFKKLRNETGTISPELNRELRERYGESIDTKEAEEVIRRIATGEPERKKVSV